MRVAPSRKPLSKKESVRWQGFMLAVFRHWDNLLYQKEANALDQQQWQGYLNVFEFWVQYPRFADWFAANKRFFSKDLAQLMDKIIAASPPPRRATRRSNKAV